MKISNVSTKYMFSQRVGQGAYGSVFLAKSKHLEEEKAIKIISKNNIKLKHDNFLS